MTTFRKSLHPAFWAAVTKHAVALLIILPVLSLSAMAHAVAEGDKGYIQEISGTNIIPFIYLGVSTPE